MMPFLCLNGVEIINAMRSLSYLRRLGDNRFYVAVTGPADDDGGYSDIYGDIYESAGSYASSLKCYCPALDDESNFQGPALDPAPWYESSRSESEDFLGIVTDSLVIENPPLRSVTALSHGGMVGRLQRRSRLLPVHGQMYATSARGMAWGERWLTEALSGSMCEDCGGDDAEVLPACPDEPSVYPTGFRSLYNVGIVDGPIFTPVAGIPGCLVQEVAFQLVAGNPYLHHAPVTASATISSGQTFANLVESQEWGGDYGVYVEIAAATALADIVVKAAPLTDPDDCGDLDVNPCVEYRIDSVPEGHVLTIDALRRRVTEYNDSLKTTQSGYRRLAFDGAFAWIEVPPCTLMCVTVTIGWGTADVEVGWALREI